MRTLAIPRAETVRPFVGGVLGALTGAGHEPTDLQHRILTAVVRAVDPSAPDTRTVEPWPAADVVAAMADVHARDELAHLVVVLEMTMHPLPREVELHVEGYLRELGVEVPYVALCRDTAQGRLAALHADFIRNSWTTEETVKGVLGGRLVRLARSKLAYYGVGGDEEIAQRWRGLGRCPDGSWGQAVHRFYEAHGFAFPGEPHGIYEIGARHDWVHVLCDYGTAPEGEIDVFAFIAATMEDPKGFVQFLFTLALFQNATISTVGGKKVLIARADTLDDDRAAERLADAFARASACTVDVMAHDPFDFADEALDALRGRWNITPKAVPGPGWQD